MRSGTALAAVLHAPPSGWDKETFERVTDALGAALVAAVEGVPRLEPRGEKDGVKVIEGLGVAIRNCLLGDQLRVGFE